MNACMKELEPSEKPLNRLVRGLGIEMRRLFPTMDCGGCGVYATVLGEQLELTGAQDVGIWASALDGYLDIDIDTVRRRIRNHASLRAWHRQGVQFVHLGVEYTWDSETWHADSGRVTPVDFGEDQYGLVYSGRLTVEEMRVLAMQPKGWNSMFDRALIPAVELRVRQVFEQYRAQHRI